MNSKNHVKISVNSGWTQKSKLAIIGLIGSISLIVLVVVFD
jgi:hypothetical protein